MRTLTNSFHNTSAEVRKSEGEIIALEKAIYTGKATPAGKAWVRRVRNKLCGINGCTCGDWISRRR